MRIRLSKHEKIFIQIIFRDDKPDYKEFENLSNLKLVKLASEHLMLTTLYSKLNEKNCLNHIDNKLKEYLKNLFEINYARNKQLIKEVNIIKKIFNKNKIKFVFIKGAALIIGNYYKNLGERMIGDIDILVDSHCYNNSIELLNSFGYKAQKTGALNINNHHPRLISDEKMFAVEIHNELTHSKKPILNKQKFFIKGKIIPSLKNIITHTIFNFQINDWGNIKGNYSYRSIYDYFILMNKNLSEGNFSTVDISSTSVDNFETITHHLVGLNYSILKSKKNNILFKYMFILNKNFVLFYFLDKIFSKTSIILYLNLLKVKRIFKNSNYRKYLLHKYTKYIFQQGNKYTF